MALYFSDGFFLSYACNDIFQLSKYSEAWYHVLIISIFLLIVMSQNTQCIFALESWNINFVLFPFDNVNIIKIYGLLTHWPCGYFWNSSSFFVASKIFRHWGLKLIAASPYSGAWMLWLMLLRWTGVPLWCSAILYLIHGIKTSLKTCLSLVFGHLQFKFQ